MSQVVVVGGGITGLFCAYYLAKEGASVTLVERGGLGEGSVHAAGLIEPGTFYQINNWRYLRDALRFARRGALRLRTLEPRWALSYIRHFNEPLDQGGRELLAQMSSYSVSEYRRLSEEDSSWSYSEPGLLEVYEDKRSYNAALDGLTSKSGWRQVDFEGYAGGIVFEDVGLVVTEKFVERMTRELEASKVKVIHAEARRVEVDGSVQVDGDVLRPERTIVAAGTACRRLGVPVTAVGGVGYRFTLCSQAKGLERPLIVYERALAVAWTQGWLKVTEGLDFDFTAPKPDAARVLGHLKRLVGDADLLDARHGFRPCSPDGLPVVGGRDRLVVATGGFRLGWSFAPAIARRAVDLTLGRGSGHPRLARYAKHLHGGNLS